MGRPKDTSKDAEMLKLRRMGLNDSEIAKTLGVCRATVRKHIGTADQTAGHTRAKVLASLEKARAARAAKRASQKPVEAPEMVEEPVVDKHTTEPVKRVREAYSASERIYETTLGDFAILPNWAEKVRELASKAQPEPWSFVNPTRERAHPDVAVLMTYLSKTFYRRVVAYNAATTQEERDNALYMRDDVACFHTGLYTPQYSGLYAFFMPNTQDKYVQRWHFQGFRAEGVYDLMRVKRLPKHLPMLTEMTPFRAEWGIRINTEHILDDNRDRLPAGVEGYWNVPLLLETAVELSRRKAVVEPSIAVPTIYKGTASYILPLYLTSPDTADLVMAIREADGFYVCSTCLTPEMAYAIAREYGRPTAKWLTDMVE